MRRIPALFLALAAVTSGCPPEEEPDGTNPLVTIEDDGVLIDAIVSDADRIALGLAVPMWAVYEDAETGARIDVIPGGVFRLTGPGAPLEAGLTEGGYDGFAFSELTPSEAGTWVATFDPDGASGDLPEVELATVEVTAAASITPLRTNWGWDEDTVWSTPSRLELIGGLQHRGFAQLVDADGRPLGGTGLGRLDGALGPIPDGSDVHFGYGQTGILQGNTDLHGVFAVELPFGDVVEGTEFVNHALDALDGYTMDIEVDDELTLQVTSPAGVVVDTGFGLEDGVSGLWGMAWITTVDGDVLDEDAAPEGWSLSIDPAGPEHVVNFTIGTLSEDVVVPGDLEIFWD